MEGEKGGTKGRWERGRERDTCNMRRTTLMMGAHFGHMTVVCEWKRGGGSEGGE